MYLGQTELEDLTGCGSSHNRGECAGERGGERTGSAGPSSGDGWAPAGVDPTLWSLALGGGALLALILLLRR